MVRALSAVVMAALVAAVGSVFLTVVSAPSALYYALGLTLTTLATGQGLFPGIGLRLPSRFARSDRPTSTSASRDREYASEVAVSTLSGLFFRITAADRPALWTPSDAKTFGRLSDRSEFPLLYAASSESAAWAELASHHGRAAGVEIQRRVTSLLIENLRVLDLTDRTVLAVLGLESSGSWPSTLTRQSLPDMARELGVEGLLLGSAAKPNDKTLAVFLDALDHVTVAGERLVSMVLPDAISDPFVRRRLSEDETLLQAFAEALAGGYFDAWLSTVELDDDDEERFRVVGATLGS